MFKSLKAQSGQSLVEVVVAIGLFAIVFSSSWQILHDSFMSISEEMVSMKAHYLVVEGVEAIRSMREEDWNTIVDGTWHFRFDETDPVNKVLVLEADAETVDDVYQRRIEISSVRRDTDTGKITEDDSYDFDPNTKLVEIFVEWQFKGQPRSDMERIYLTNWARF